MTHLDLPKPPVWTAAAICATVDPELWFPEKPGPNVSRDAIATCRRCPVRTQCLQAALDRNEEFGVFGGLTARERRNMTHERQAA